MRPGTERVSGSANRRISESAGRRGSGAAGARAAFERALRIDEAAFGPDHPNVARDLNNLGGVLQALGEYAEARAAFERALRILEQTLPPDHPHIRTVRGNLVSLGGREAGS